VGADAFGALVEKLLGRSSPGRGFLHGTLLYGTSPGWRVRILATGSLIPITTRCQCRNPLRPLELTGRAGNITEQAGQTVPGARMSFMTGLRNAVAAFSFSCPNCPSPVLTK